MTTSDSRLTTVLPGYRSTFDPTQLHRIGILLGEGVGPEVVPVAIGLLELLEAHSDRRFDLCYGGAIGYPAKAICGRSLSPEVETFAADLFARDGVLFCGPGGERFVYELRHAFELFCKFTPIQPLTELRQAGVVRSKALACTDIIAVRENSGGIYQGQWDSARDSSGQRVASQSFAYTEHMVTRILHAAFALAEQRRNRLHVVLKPGGVPSISALWRDCTEELSTQYDVEYVEQEVDNAVYQLIADPGQFDVVVSPNMFGDVLADCGSLLLGSRGLSFSGNFGLQGRAVYQTGHGAARDIAGKNLANPIGQILSLGMMLKESFCWPQADHALRHAVRQTLANGYTTADVDMPGYQVLGTREFGQRVADQLRSILDGLPI